MSAKHTPETTRVDVDFYPAWMDENPALFVQRVREFLADHPAEHWERHIGEFACRVRFTAIAKINGDAAPFGWYCELVDSKSGEIVHSKFFRDGPATKSDRDGFEWRVTPVAAIAKATGSAS